MVVDLHSLTVSASLDIVDNVLFHPWPPVSTFNDLYRFTYSWVTMDREVVFGLDNGMFFFGVARYNLLTLMIPDTVDLLEFVGIYPHLDLLFVLRRFFWSNGCAYKHFVGEYRDSFV